MYIWLIEWVSNVNQRGDGNMTMGIKRKSPSSPRTPLGDRQIAEATAYRPAFALPLLKDNCRVRENGGWLQKRMMLFRRSQRYAPRGQSKQDMPYRHTHTHGPPSSLICSFMYMYTPSYLSRLTSALFCFTFFCFGEGEVLVRERVSLRRYLAYSGTDRYTFFVVSALWPFSPSLTTHGDWVKSFLSFSSVQAPPF